ncbi:MULTISPECIES: hypothetical protein [Emticicia]|uniref:hypothetical protein n=1 Tax=Emticicia TaxID=312278 RepID=UPI00209D5CEE|nr:MULTISPECIES: hypothetical protein [Emticicia]UTA66898.1 hypothetical protein MB380_14940 [Emticicia sp. 21SJ11W-3]
MKPKTNRQLIAGIFLITEQIQNQYPELYAHLGETPLFLSYEEKRISTINFEQYLESIQQQLNAFLIKTGKAIGSTNNTFWRDKP